MDAFEIMRELDKIFDKIGEIAFTQGAILEKVSDQLETLKNDVNEVKNLITMEGDDKK